MFPSAPPALDDSLTTSDLLRSAEQVVEQPAMDQSRPGSIPGSMEDDNEMESPERNSNKLPPIARNAVQPLPPSEAIPGEQPIGWKPPINTDTPNAETDKRIDDLLNMLECPVCLDIVDKPPIYQCPEGHLLCESCNNRLKDCPQCGHALVNSRNRMAEDLTLVLQSLRGSVERDQAYNSSQTVIISVSEPKKVRKGLFASVVYQMKTQVGLDNNSTQTFVVERKYSEIVQLYDELHREHKSKGIIVPPPPEKNRLATVAVKMSPNTDLNASIASVAIEKRCVALDRYMKRMGKHPVLKKDPMFRSFLQEKELPKGMFKGKTLGEKMSNFMGKFSMSRFTSSEKDPWFQTKTSQLDALTKQLKEMKNNLKDMSSEKQKLYELTNDFQRGLVSMLVGRQNRENGLSAVLGEVVGCHKTMGLIHQEQSKADELIVQLAIDYEYLVISAKEVMEERLKYQQSMEKSQKGKNPLEEIEKIQNEFGQLSQTIRRELEHFDFVMRDEFQEAFTAYNTKYWQSLRNTVRKRSDDPNRTMTSILNNDPDEPIEIS